MKKVINKAIILSVLLLAAVSAKGSKSRKNQRSERGENGIVVMGQGMMGSQLGIAQTNQNQVGIAQQPLTQGGVVKLFDEEKHLREKLQREKTYSALQYVALECIHIIETLDRAQNKLGLGQLALTNNTNPNTVLSKSVAVQYADISNVGGLGYYLFGNNGFTPKGDSYVFQQPQPLSVVSSPSVVSPVMPVNSSVVAINTVPVGVSMAQELSQEIVAVENFIRKWTDQAAYLNTRPDDQGFMTEFKNSYLTLKNLVKKYLGQDLRSLVLKYPDRVNNEISALIAILNNQLLPILFKNPNYRLPYENLKLKINPLGYNARYIFGLLCENIYSDGQSMSSHNAKIWAQNGIPLTENEKIGIRGLMPVQNKGNSFLKAVSPLAAIFNRIK